MSDETHKPTNRTAKVAKYSKAAKAKRQVRRAPTQQTITIPYLDADTTFEDARELLAGSFPGWAELSKLEKDEATRLVLSNRGTLDPVKVKLTQKAEGGFAIELAGKSETLTALKLHSTFAANSLDPVNARANELLQYLGSVGANNTDRYNAALSFIESMAPRDQAEALLLVQMYCTHDAAVRALSQMGKAEWVPQMQTFGNLATKLLRVSQGQMETLAKMRRGGEQVVRHIHVDNRGGQAVIAENVHTGGQWNERQEQSHATGEPGFSSALLGSDAFGFGVPIPGSKEQATVSNARGD